MKAPTIKRRVRVSKPPQERKAELVLAARRLFDEKGVDKTKVSDIVGAVGVAQGVFYYYFRSKKEMVNEVAANISAEMEMRMEQVLQNPSYDFFQKYAAFMEMYLEMADRFTADEPSAVAEHVPPAEEHALAVSGILPAYLEELVRQGVDGGVLSIDYPLETARALLHGLRAYAMCSRPNRHLIYTIVEQAMGLPPSALINHVNLAKTESPPKG